MPGVSSLLPGAAPVTGAAMLPFWVAAFVVLALLAVVALMVLGRNIRIPDANFWWRGAAVALGALIAWGLVDYGTSRNNAAMREALDARAAELTVRAMAPGSPLACLDALGSAAVEAACERSVFARPETVAQALAYVDARLKLLADGAALEASDALYASAVARTRRALEADRFGLVAQVLATRGCTPQHCQDLKLLRETRRVSGNLREQTFQANVVMHAAAWRSAPQAEAEAAVASAAPVSVPQAAAPQAPALAAMPGFAAVPPAATTGTGVPLSPKYDFPSAASIPPVSIMNAEPSGPGTEAASTSGRAAPSAAAAPNAPQRSTQPQAAPQAPGPQPAPQRAPSAAPPPR